MNYVARIGCSADVLAAGWGEALFVEHALEVMVYAKSSLGETPQFEKFTAPPVEAI